MSDSQHPVGQSQPTPEGEPTVMYTRELPGGGHVTIEAGEKTDDGVVGRIAVERRCEPRRRAGHEPPVIAEARGEQPAEVFRELYEIATDNVAIARGLIQWQSRRRT